MNTVKVDTAGDLILAHLPGRDEAVCMDTDDAVYLVLALATALPDLQAILEDTVRRLTPPRTKRRAR